MINVFLVLYLIFLAVTFIVACVILFHLWAYYLNKTVAIALSTSFCAVYLMMVIISISIAAKVDWGKFTIYF